MSSTFEELQRRLGHSFADENLLRQALTHASFGHEKRQRLPDNQRLEFLGDAVLQLAVTAELYCRFPELPEGRLTILRARLVNRHHLQGLAQNLGLGDHLILRRGGSSAWRGLRRGRLGRRTHHHSAPARAFPRRDQQRKRLGRSQSQRKS